MNGKIQTILVAALIAALSCAAQARAETSLYVGDAKDYSIAFKAEGAELYVMQFAGRTDCYYTEPHEDIGSGGFTVFPAPKLMREGPRGFVAEESFSISMWGGANARVRAELGGDMVTGDYSYDESEESFHCDTGFSPDPFRASRYQPIGSAGAAPAGGEVGVYYGSEGPLEIFLRTPAKAVAGIRGTFVSQCPVGRGKATPDPHALFGRPAFAKRSEGRFGRRVVYEGKTRSGRRYKEVVSLAGRVERDAIAGAYRRVRTMKSGGRRCVTGPLPFRAVRYLPARG
ncbi:MAG TPA: hypothetical protein VGV34_03285 [Solirubrobacterales bacterium]|nr:hypothetical protein [Solirubrobacterales bacterium]